MRLTNNFLSRIISVLFIVLMGFLCYEVGYSTITNAANPSSTGGVVVFGPLLFIIGAYFIKEGEFLQFFQKNGLVLFLLEVLVVVSAILGLWVFSDFTNITLGIMTETTLFCIYLLARLTAGRIGGIFGIIFGFFIMNSLCIPVMTVDTYPSMIALFVSAILFVFVTKYVSLIAHMSLVMTVTYLFIAVVFALAFTVNPFILIFLAASIISLLFGKVPMNDKRERVDSIYYSGIVCALLLLVFTLLALFGINLLIASMKNVDFFKFPIVDEYLAPFFRKMDPTLLKQKDMGGMLLYLVDKMKELSSLFLYPFSSGIFPSFVAFFSLAAGVYVFRKPSSYLTPITITYTALFGIYLLYDSKSSDFTYLYCFSSVFAAYAVSNFLVFDTSNQAIPRATYLGEIPFPDTVVVPEEMDVAEKENVEEVKTPVAPVVPSQPIAPTPPVIPEPPVPPVAPAPVVPQPVMQEPVAAPKQPVVPQPVIAKESVRELEQRSEYPEWQLDADYVEPVTVANKEEPLVEKENVPVSNEESDLTQWAEDDTLLTKKEEVEEPVISLHSEKDNEFDATHILVTPATLEEGIGDVVHDTEQFVTTTENTLEEGFFVGASSDDQLDILLDRLDLRDNIRRMNEAAWEDMAEVIEQGEDEKEIENAITAEDMTIIEEPFDMIQPLNIPEEEDDTLLSLQEDDAFSLDDLTIQEPAPVVFDSGPVVPIKNSELVFKKKDYYDEEPAFMFNEPVNVPLHKEVPEVPEIPVPKAVINEPKISLYEESPTPVKSLGNTEIRRKAKPIVKKEGLTERTYHRFIIK